MGMSIDKAIAELELLKKNTFSYMSAHQAFITAIDTMRKYQKIKEILNTNVVYRDSDFMKLSAIKRVIDGDKQEDIFGNL